MSQTASFYVNSPVSGTQYWGQMATGVIWNSADSGTALEVHVICWSGPNGTGSHVAPGSVTAIVWDQTTNSAKGSFTAGSGNVAAAAAESGVTNGDWLKVSGKFTGSAVGSLEMYITYTASSLFIPTQPTFSPAAGGVGTSVTLTGSHFTDAGFVHLNGLNCPSFTVNSDTQITVTVPSGATTGPFVVGNTNGSSPGSAANFLVAVGYIFRSSVWTAGQVLVERSSVETAAQGVFVYRSGVWTAAG